MANAGHIDILRQGVEVWNQWRQENPEVQPDLSGADFAGHSLRWANLRGADLSRAKLNAADLTDASLWQANLGGANLNRATLCRANISDAKLSWANLGHANLEGASLVRARLIEALLTHADFTNARLAEANLQSADLRYARFVGTDLQGANLTHCSIYGISAWNLKLDGCVQIDLDITRTGEPTVTVDDLEVAQFIYLLLNNERVRRIVKAITTKVVLILGRFTTERKAILGAIRAELRHYDYLPVLFDFEKPSTRDTVETISTLAHMARFIIADITEPRSVPQELQAIVPNLPSVPVQLLLAASEVEYGMSDHLKRYPWVLDVFRYSTLEDLASRLREKIIEPAEAKARELQGT